MSIPSGPGADAPAPAAPSPDARRDAVRALEGTFAQLFAQLRRAYAQAAEAVSPGMLPGTFKLFATIDRIGPVTVSGLAEKMDSDKALMSRAVTELESLGFVERTPDPADGRVKLIAVTTLGRERLEAVRHPYLLRLEDGFVDWPLPAIERLTELLQALADGVTPAG